MSFEVIRRFVASDAPVDDRVIQSEPTFEGLPMRYNPTSDFSDLLRVLYLGRGNRADAALMAERAPERVQSVIRAASDVAGITAANAPGLTSLTAAFLEGLAHQSILDRWLADGVATMPYAPGPDAIIGTQILGGTVIEGAAKPAGSLHLASNLRRSKAAVLTIVSESLMRSPRGGAVAEQQIRTSLVSALNSAIADMLVAEFVQQSIPSSGSTAAAVLEDLADAAVALGATDTSRLYLLVSPATLTRLALMPAASGPAFLDLGTTGGQIQSIAVMAAASLGADSPADALLVDGMRLAVADGGLELSTAMHANIVADDAPGSANAGFSLWQRNCLGLRCERPFAIGAASDTSGSPVVAISGAW
jgi:hypothetical protein